jgi:hypothetical protein
MSHSPRSPKKRRVDDAQDATHKNEDDLWRQFQLHHEAFAVWIDACKAEEKAEEASKAARAAAFASTKAQDAATVARRFADKAEHDASHARKRAREALETSQERYC